ncbi:Fe-S cluster assembly sulfur transfer protein SufU [Candidatus Latescibacterota bacterium]
MSELRELYQQVILDHNKTPRNFGKLDDANHHQEGFNPLCGDHLHVYLHLDDEEVIEGISFEGSGCAISRASASLMTEAIKGKSVAEAMELFKRFQELVTSSTDVAAQTEGVGKLAVLAGVREFPMRVKCATLAWHTMKAAAEGEEEAITTE